MGAKVIAAAVLLLSQAPAVVGRPQDQGIVRVTTSYNVHPSELANVHLEWHGVPPSTIKALYGSCQNLNSTTPQTIGDFHVQGHPPQRLAWAVPDDAISNNCIYVSGPSHQILGKKIGRAHV